MILADTSSLFALAHYYQPLQDGSCVDSLLMQLVQNGTIKIIDAVLEECARLSQGKVISRFQFLSNNVENTRELVPNAPQRFDRMLDNNFCNLPMKKNLPEEEYIVRKNAYYKTADCKLIVYAYNVKTNTELFQEEVIIMTEESKFSNDGKLFKKIPAICENLGISIISATDFMKSHNARIFIDQNPLI